MTDWRQVISSTDYKSALKATDSLEPPAVGFVKPAEVCSNSMTALSSIIKQNNTILQTLLLVVERVRDLEEQLKQIQAAPKVASETFESSLAALQNQLQNLSLGGSKPAPVAKKKGKLFVFKDPKKIFEEEKLKLS